MNDSVTGTNDSTKGGWWRRLTGGLKRSSSALGGAISDLVTKRKLDAETIEEIEDALIRADLGIDVARRIATTLGADRRDKAISSDEVKAVVAGEIEKALADVALPLVIDAAKKPFVILVAGVNGSGKTTTIGKLAAQYRAEGRSVIRFAPPRSISSKSGQGARGPISSRINPAPMPQALCSTPSLRRNKKALTFY
jgi:fused signal recognition particle receptor